MTASQKEIIARLHRLPSLPLAVQAVIASFSDPDLDTASLARKITQDQGLSARVLRVANSSFYGLQRKVGSIQDAVVVLGFDAIRSLVMSAGVIQGFPSLPGSLFDRNAYWRRSFHVAGYAMALADCLRQGQQMAFTAGMFHDIGQLVLDVCIPEQLSEILEQQKISGQSLIEAEQSGLGFDHALIGADVAKLWNFPPEIEHAIRYWRTPVNEPFEPVTGIVHVAALLEGGLEGEALIGRLPGALRDRLNISWERIGLRLPERDQLDAVSGLMLAE
ncbi:MAG: HDOD domain-containing protein [Nitrosomonadales bacterium]|nr:HDOD domain-containing protein [Nitrosomonadales bacterium]